MIFNLLGLGFILSLDNFRSALTLGLVGFRWWRSLSIAVVFGFFDGLAPLIGILLGKYASNQIGGSISDFVGPIVLGLLGVYFLVDGYHEKASEERSYNIIVFGLPIPLSLDNVVAGFGLGLTGVSAVVPAAVFGTTTFVMSLAGLELGKIIGRFFPLLRVRWEYVAGIALIVESIIFGLGLLP